jgi:hypothetical protein
VKPSQFAGRGWPCPLWVNQLYLVGAWTGRPASPLQQLVAIASCPAELFNTKHQSTACRQLTEPLVRDRWRPFLPTVPTGQPHDVTLRIVGS